MPRTQRNTLTREIQHSFDCCLSGFTMFIIKIIMLFQSLCFSTVSVTTTLFFPQYLNLPFIIDSHRCCISAFPICIFFHLETFLYPCYLDCSLKGNCPVQHTTVHTNSGIIFHIFFATNIHPLP